MTLYSSCCNAAAVATSRYSNIHPPPAAVAAHGKQQQTLKAVTGITVEGGAHIGVKF